MKNVMRLLAAVALLLASAMTMAHGPVSAPKFGGIVAEANDVEYELVAKADSLTLYVEDHHKQVDTKGAAARVTMLADGHKSETALAPAGENRLQAKGAFAVAAGTKVVVVVTLPGKPAATVRMVLK